MPLDPNTSTRAEFTASYLSIAPLPTDSGASPKWTRLVNSLLSLIKALGEHEAMQRNNQQTYMTPAENKNAQYFAWDFVGRTIVSSCLFFLLSYLLGMRVEVIAYSFRCPAPERWEVICLFSSS